MENNESKLLDSNRSEGLVIQVSDLVERAVSNTFGAVTDIIAEARAIAGATFGYGETVSKSVLLLGRKLVERAIDSVAEVAQRSERASRSVVQTVRATGSDAIETAAQALTVAIPAKAPSAPSRVKA